MNGRSDPSTKLHLIPIQHIFTKKIYWQRVILSYILEMESIEECEETMATRHLCRSVLSNYLEISNNDNARLSYEKARATTARFV